MTVRSMHIPVLTEEVIINLLHDKDGRYLDVTSGFGGHSTAILEQLNHGSLIATDQDPDAIKYLKNKFESEKRITIHQSRFSDLAQLLHSENFDGILADIGVSSYQLDNPERGFSFMKDGPLDMRMNPLLEINAEKIIETLTEKELADLIYKYGDERLSRKISRKIKTDLKEKGKYSGTKDLAYSIAGCFPPKQRYKKIHPATRTFQALRIAVNAEIEALENFLEIVPNWLLPGGIISIISFHSIEDRLVKNSFKSDERLKNLTKKPITPNEQEIINNKRSRSAKLRIAQLNY